MTLEDQNPETPSAGAACAHAGIAHRLAAALRDELHMCDPAASHSTDEYTRITAARHERLAALAEFDALTARNCC